MPKRRARPDAIDMAQPHHRLIVVRAYHALLSHGGDAPDHDPECMRDERKAKAKAASYALRHWNDLQD